MKHAALFLLVAFLSVAAAAEDWPTYLHDNARSGVTAETLTLPLGEAWVFKSRQAPCPAWPAPAKQDFWHELRELKPVVTYDRAFMAVSTGDAVYFGSSADDKVYCLNTHDGSVRWTFYTEGPVRLAPSVWNGLVFFTSDDGCAYCLKADSGELVWKHRPGDQIRLIPGNGRIISTAPARTGVLVEDGIAYYFAGLMPTYEVYKCALEAATGKPLWCEKTDEVSPQGYLLASPEWLFVPTGRTDPMLYEKATGRKVQGLGGPGGAYAVLIDDAVVSGPGRRTGEDLIMAEPKTKESVAQFPGVRMVVHGVKVYLQSRNELSSLDRVRYVELSRQRNTFNEPMKNLNDQLKAQSSKESEEAKKLQEEIAVIQKQIDELTAQMNACFYWKKPLPEPYSLVLAGDTLFAGGDGILRAFSTDKGEEVWQAEVPGRVYGLSVANGNLYASTDQGAIHCFKTGKFDRERVVTDLVETVPYGQDKQSLLYAAAADAIVAHSGVDKGYCLVLGAGEGRLAWELAQRTELQVVGVEESAKHVAQARGKLDASGLYGVRLGMNHWKGDRLPYTTYMANLIVSDEALVSGRLSVPAKEVFRVLRPFGGVAMIGAPRLADGPKPKLSRDDIERWAREGGVEVEWVDDATGLWAVIRRGPLENTGEWTQLYANPNHTACSMDPIQGPLSVQWFGAPGPRDMIDRHHRPMSSLFKDGRIFIPANDMIMAVDAYNGFPLWTLEVPNSRRIGALKNSGQMLATKEFIYIATQDKVWAVDVENGARAFIIDAPLPSKEAGDWGYINCMDDRLFGTGQVRGASFDQLDWDTCDLLEGDHRPVITSRCLFSVDRFSGKKKWVYEKGAILNNGIVVDGSVGAKDGRIYFFECRNKDMIEDADGRIKLRDFFGADTFLVALDLKSGHKAWERSVNLPFQHIAYLNGAHGTLLACGTHNRTDEVYYALAGFDMGTGKDIWTTEYRALDIRGNDFTGPGGSHGEQWQHPVIIGDTFYSRPFAFDLHTGQKKDYIARRGGHGCGGLTGSAHYLYGRGDNPRMYPLDVQSTDGIQITRVSRPGCWLNIIPAGGMILIPESSSGCTCAYPLQTSFGFIPESVLGPAS